MIEAAIRLKTEIPQGAAFLGEYQIIGEYHASFSGCDEFIGVKTETA